MRHLIFSIFLFCSVRLFGQFFTDDFSDGEIISDPAWTGDILNFSAITGELQLQGDCILGGENYLSTAVSTKDSAVWTFYVRCDFDPSTSNYAKVYLQSDNADLSGDLNGYFIQIGGETGSIDAVKLYRQEGSTNSLVLSGVEGGAATAPEMGVKVIRSNAGEWKLLTDYSGGTDYIFETSAFDTGINGGTYMGLACIYTSTRCTLFYFDNFFADPLYADTDAPAIASVHTTSATQLVISFNENVALPTAENESNYTVSAGVGSPLNASRDFADNSIVTLTFADAFPTAVPLTLTVTDVEDPAGNAITTENAGFSYFTIQLYDIIIDEIFADETPVIGLPEAEYIELYNTTDIDINLSGFTITDGSAVTDAVPAYILKADSFLIVTDDSHTGLFDSYGDVLYISGFPSLNNDGDFIQLLDAENNLVHGVQYTSDWYNDAIKEDGGYSLEMIDTNNPCQGKENWIASNSATGGTPGLVNSVAADNADATAPSVLNAYPSATDSLIVYFDEALELSSVTAAAFSVDGGIGAAAAAFIDAANPQQVRLFFSTPFSVNVLYALTCSGIKDCSGNETLLHNTAQFGLTEAPEAMDIVINEVLFNPQTNGFDYVELYNRSDKFIDLSKINLAEFDLDDTTSMSEFTQVSEAGKLFLPGSYVLVTADIETVAEDYFISNTENFVENNNTPNYNDDEGIVAITDITGNPIDQLHYYSGWHFALLDDEDGVSLERLVFDAPTQDVNNWHSAAEDKHYGTPGYQNSIVGDDAAGEDLLSLETEVFSPDGDGYHDYLILHYNAPLDGYVASILIYDAQGRQIDQLANNTEIARTGFFTWDGLNADDQKASMGIYIAYAELFDLNGSVHKEKLKFTLARK